MHTDNTTGGVPLSVNNDVIGKATAQQMASLNTRMTPTRLTCEELSRHVQAGYSFCVAQLTPRPDGLGFATRTSASWEAAQLIAIDIDNSITYDNEKRQRTEAEGYVTVEDLLRDEFISRHAYLIYTSPSHTDTWHRIRLVFCAPEAFTKPAHYKRAIDAFIARFSGDTATSSVVNIFYGSPQCQTFPLGNVLTIEAMRETVERYSQQRSEERRASRNVTGTTSVESTREMLTHIPPDVPYLDWVKVIAGVSSAHDPETAERIICEWSDGKRGEVAAKIKHRLTNINYGTAVYIAKQYGYVAGSTAATAADSGTVSKVEAFLSANYRTRYNTLSCRLQVAAPDGEWLDLVDYHLHSMLRRMRSEKISASAARLHEILMSDFTPQYDPLTEYFDSLRSVDGQDYIQSIVDLIGEDDPDRKDYNYLVFSHWLMSAVACAIDGKPNHICIVLQGSQGVGKTSLLLALAPPALKNYVHVGGVTPDKDSLIALATSFLFIDDEFETSNRKENGLFKRIITQGDIHVRAPYMRIAENRVRRASFLCSVNRETFLTDETGSRRFPVIAVRRPIDIEALRAVNIDMVWAQARNQYLSGEQYWFDSATIEIVERMNRSFQHVTQTDDLLAKYFAPPTGAAGERVSHLTATEIVLAVATRVAESNPDAKITANGAMVQAMGKSLAAAGYIRGSTRRKNGPCYTYALVESGGSAGTTNGIIGSTYVHNSPN